MNAARRMLDVVAIVIVVAALVIVLRHFIAQGPGSSDSMATADTLPPDQFVKLINGGDWIGPRTAPVVVLTYSDYACGFCAEAHDNLRTLRARYPQHVAVVIKHFVKPTLLASFKVPLAAACAAEQGQFEGFHNAAFANGRVLHYSNGWRIIADSGDVHDLGALGTCVDARRYTARVAGDYDEGVRLGVKLTPTMFVNGERVVGSPPMHALDSIIASQFPMRRLQPGDHP